MLHIYTYLFVFDRDFHSHLFGHWFTCEFRYPDDLLLVENFRFCYDTLFLVVLICTGS